MVRLRGVGANYKNAAGRVANELLYRHDEPRLQVVERGRPWSFDDDGEATASYRPRCNANGSAFDHQF